jgi:hypothetical protein
MPLPRFHVAGSIIVALALCSRATIGTELATGLGHAHGGAAQAAAMTFGAALRCCYRAGRAFGRRA